MSMSWKLIGKLLVFTNGRPEGLLIITISSGPNVFELSCSLRSCKTACLAQILPESHSILRFSKEYRSNWRCSSVVSHRDAAADSLPLRKGGVSNSVTKCLLAEMKDLISNLRFSGSRVELDWSITGDSMVFYTKILQFQVVMISRV